MCKFSSFNLQKNAVRFGSGLSHFSAHPSWVIPRWFRPYLQISILHFYRSYIWETSSNLGKLPWVWHGACFSGKNQAKFGIKLYAGIPAQIFGLPKGCWCRMGQKHQVCDGSMPAKAGTGVGGRNEWRLCAGEPWGAVHAGSVRRQNLPSCLAIACSPFVYLGSLPVLHWAWLSPRRRLHSMKWPGRKGKGGGWKWVCVLPGVNEKHSL